MSLFQLDLPTWDNAVPIPEANVDVSAWTKKGSDKKRTKKEKVSTSAAKHADKGFGKSDKQTSKVMGQKKAGSRAPGAEATPNEAKGPKKVEVNPAGEEATASAKRRARKKRQRQRMAEDRQLSKGQKRGQAQAQAQTPSTPPSSPNPASGQPKAKPAAPAVDEKKKRRRNRKGGESTPLSLQATDPKGKRKTPDSTKPRTKPAKKQKVEEEKKLSVPAKRASLPQNPLQIKLEGTILSR